MKPRTSGLAADSLCILAWACSPAAAAAAPVTVDLRIEGGTATLFEGPVTTDVRTFRFTTSPTEYRCDGTSANQGTSAVPVPTRGAALAEASERAPFTTSGQFFASLGSPSFSEIAGQSVAFDAATNAFLGEYENGRFASTGACGDAIATGDRVLFAYGTGSETILQLAAPARARPGETVELTVTDAGDGQPVAGAEVGGQATDAQGRARVLVGPRGETAFKATKAGAVRSNRVTVCATDGQDGFCGSAGAATGVTGAPTPTPPAAAPRDTGRPIARVARLREQQVFPRGRAPRELAIAANDPSGIAQVKLRLTRRARGGRCAYLSRRRDRFVRIRCGRTPALFAASDRASFSYLLPEALTPGRYVLDVVAIDRAGNRARLARGSTRTVFFVR